MAGKELTFKQEKFVQNLIQGMTQREAYKNSYNAEKMKDETIDNKAYQLFKKDEVRARYDELLEELENEAIMTAQKRMMWLSNVVQGYTQEEVLVELPDGTKVKEKVPAKLDTRLKAMDQLNKMSGEYVTKVEGNVQIAKKLEELL